jgi:hypothetical protein
MAALSLYLGGCDKRSQANSSPAADTNANTTAANPQEEPRKKLALISVPVVLSVPQSWKIEPPNNPAYLEGSATDGDVQISLSILASLTDSSRRLYIEAAVNQSKKHPRRLQIRQSTTDNGMQVLERITYAGLPATLPDEPIPATEPSAPLSWSIIVFVPYEKKFIPCSFDLLKLTQKQYTDDEPFIKSIVNSAEVGDLALFK